MRLAGLAGINDRIVVRQMRRVADEAEGANHVRRPAARNRTRTPSRNQLGSNVEIARNGRKLNRTRLRKRCG
jgi:hypothetical protein